MRYGNAPTNLGVFDLDWDEYMHYMYLPIWIAESHQGFGPLRALPERLRFLAPLVHEAIYNATENGERGWDYVYVCARRGFATPGNPLNRPGWHSDGFGSDDLNYVWTDRFPTLFAEMPFGEISDDHVVSAEQFGARVAYACGVERREDEVIKTYPDRSLLRLDPSVIHAAPEIPAPGGERGFVKISFSNNRYNLKGNSHNYLLDYDWKMYDRAELRNDPAYAGGDAGPQ